MLPRRILLLLVNSTTQEATNGQEESEAGSNAIPLFGPSQDPRAWNPVRLGISGAVSGPPPGKVNSRRRRKSILFGGGCLQMNAITTCTTQDEANGQKESEAAASATFLFLAYPLDSSVPELPAIGPFTRIPAGFTFPRREIAELGFILAGPGERISSRIPGRLDLSRKADIGFILAGPGERISSRIPGRPDLARKAEIGFIFAGPGLEKPR